MKTYPMQQAATKRSYHPYILIAFYLNFLPDDVAAKIPYSTRYEWKSKDFNSLFGNAFFKDNQKCFETLELVAQNQKLQSTIQLLIKIIALSRFIKTYQERIKLNIGNIRNIAVLNIQKINKHWSLATIFRLLQLDAKTYYRWRNHIACKRSVIDKCMVRHPAQLLSKEVQQIKNYAIDERFTNWSLASVYHQMRRDGLAHFYLSTFYKYCRALQIQ